ncbi:hypothetical protein COCOBI_02-0280 [Coccomyxa sp. Obi]|nr:hypothetical protein COCOBI_02-0280 [Coccomyxa sp. Obi]
MRDPKTDETQLATNAAQPTETPAVFYTMASLPVTAAGRQRPTTDALVAAGWRIREGTPPAGPGYRGPPPGGNAPRQTPAAAAAARLAAPARLTGNAA